MVERRSESLNSVPQNDRDFLWDRINFCDKIDRLARLRIAFDTHLIRASAHECCDRIIEIADVLVSPSDLTSDQHKSVVGCHCLLLAYARRAEFNL